MSTEEKGETWEPSQEMAMAGTECSSGDFKKWADSRHILKVKLIGFADRLVEGVKERQIKINTLFDLSNWNCEVTHIRMGKISQEKPVKKKKTMGKTGRREESRALSGYVKLDVYVRCLRGTQVQMAKALRDMHMWSSREVLS